MEGVGHDSFLVVKERTPDIATTCVPAFFFCREPVLPFFLQTGNKKEGDVLTHPNHNIGIPMLRRPILIIHLVIQSSTEENKKFFSPLSHSLYVPLLLPFRIGGEGGNCFLPHFAGGGDGQYMAYARALLCTSEKPLKKRVVGAGPRGGMEMGRRGEGGGSIFGSSSYSWRKERGAGKRRGKRCRGGDGWRGGGSEEGGKQRDRTWDNS